MYVPYVYIYLPISDADSFTEKDAFVGYQSDTPASIVFKVWQDLNLNETELSNQWEEKVNSICAYH